MAQNIYEIPLTPAQNQKISISLSNVVYNMLFKWLDCDQGGWAIDILDVNNNVVIGGIPLVTGIDLLGQYAYLGLGGALIVQSDGNPNAVPTFDNLGAQSHLYYLTVN